MLGGDAAGNLGDRAILQSTCLELQVVHPDAELTVVATGENGFGRSMRVRTVPRGPSGFLGLCRAAARSDLVLCGGGGLFQDDDSLVKMPYWGLRVALVRLFCPRVIGYSLGVGPLAASTSRLFARLAFACMKRISVRDPRSRKTAGDLTRKPIELAPDPALLLPPVAEEEARRWLLDREVPLDGRPIVGVALRRWFPPRPRIVPHHVAARTRPDLGESAGSERLTDLLAQVLDTVARRHDAFVLFLPTYNVPHEGDDRICRLVLEKMSVSRAKVLSIDDPALYKGVARVLSVLLGGRMHPAIFATSVGTPAVGLAYNPKFQGFFEMLGLEGRVMGIERFVREERVEELSDLVSNAMGGGDDLLDRVATLADAARELNRDLFRGAA